MPSGAAAACCLSQHRDDYCTAQFEPRCHHEGPKGRSYAARTRGTLPSNRHGGGYSRSLLRHLNRCHESHASLGQRPPLHHIRYRRLQTCLLSMRSSRPRYRACAGWHLASVSGANVRVASKLFPLRATSDSMSKRHVPIRQNKYDACTFHVQSDDGRTEEDWRVGPRYQLLHYLGSGSFSRVCAARDTATGTVVCTLPLTQHRRVRFRGSSSDSAADLLACFAQSEHTAALFLSKLKHGLHAIRVQHGLAM